MVALIPVLVAIAGVLMYALLEGKASEIGRILFWTATLVALLGFAGHSVRLF
jgi:hypothetical protein